MDQNLNALICGDTDCMICRKSVETTPSAGANTFPSVGRIAKPFPNNPLAKASSSTADNGRISPLTEHLNHKAPFAPLHY